MLLVEWLSIAICYFGNFIVNCVNDKIRINLL